MITSYICSWEAPCTVGVYTGAETFLDHDVINLIMCFPLGLCHVHLLDGLCGPKVFVKQ